MAEIVKVPTHAEEISALASQVVELIRAGELVVIPTDTTYAVITDPFHEDAVELLRAAKGQDSHVPLPIAAGSIQTAQGVAQLQGLALDLAQAFWPGQLTLMVAPQPSVQLRNLNGGTAVSLRVPEHDFARQVIVELGPTVMTGANRVGQPMVTTVQQAHRDLGDKVCLYLDGGTLTARTSSVIDATGEHLRLVREGVLSLATIREVVPMVVNATA